MPRLYSIGNSFSGLHLPKVDDVFKYLAEKYLDRLNAELEERKNKKAKQPAYGAAPPSKLQPTAGNKKGAVKVLLIITQCVFHAKLTSCLFRVCARTERQLTVMMSVR